MTADDLGRRATDDRVETYQQRRAVVAVARADTSLRLYAAAEVSYVASETDAVREFLSTADFASSIGGVHVADQYDYTTNGQCAAAGDKTHRAAVERYYDAVVGLVESELSDVLGTDSHPPDEPSPRVSGLTDSNDQAAIDIGTSCARQL